MTTQSSNNTALASVSNDGPLVSPAIETGTPVIDDGMPQFHEAALALLATLSPERRMSAERRGKKQARYVTMPKDALIANGIDELCENAAAAAFGESGKRRALFLIGESDSGKTRAMEFHIPKRKEFLPYRRPSGELVTPFVSFECPRPITLKGFARKALEACGYPNVSHKLTEQELFDLLKATIRNNRILFMHIDEMQHVMKGTTTNEIQNVSDIIKSLLQIPGWPLHMILSGVPSLGLFLSPEDGDAQLRNRSFVVELKQMTRPDAEALLALQQHMVRDEGVLLGETDSIDFAHRLIHAYQGACGTIIQAIQGATERAQTEHENEPAGTASGPAVKIKHYAADYAFKFGCRPSANVFLVNDWERVDPRQSLAHVIAKAPRETKPSRSRKKEA
ncbi:ATP-binding protein [Rhizobium sp. 862_C5_N1_2]|uniref:ATP-binding protein n=1 Tax=Rhizobium sp. 862_C5_N1_2 TaxID=3276277 RepID=UPI003F234A11